MFDVGYFVSMLCHKPSPPFCVLLFSAVKNTLAKLNFNPYPPILVRFSFLGFR
jgi:hypothetical protein